MFYFQRPSTNRLCYVFLLWCFQSCIDNNEAMMRVLVEKGANVNVTDRELWTPLHAASTCGHRHLAKFLIEK